MTKKEIEYRKSEKKFQKMIKRIFDVVFSIFILILLSPVFIIITFLIIIDDGFPVFFKQDRSGMNNKTFKMYKFRSMKNVQVPVPSNSHTEYNWEDGVPDDFIFKSSSEDNPNITKVGKFIRKYSLDELPQFINVLKGDMSIIGPRPEIVQITKFYSEKQKRRLEVKPGITGWAQVNGRSDINHGKKIEYDLHYVENFSIWLDLKILIKTILLVFTGRGAI